MKAEAFEELLASVRQLGEIRRGERRPSRSRTFKPTDVKAVRADLGQSQSEFALMIGVSVATLRNWEQGRRTPDGPALALLQVAAHNPTAVVEALHGGVVRRDGELAAHVGRGVDVPEAVAQSHHEATVVRGREAADVGVEFEVRERSARGVESMQPARRDVAVPAS